MANWLQLVLCYKPAEQGLADWHRLESGSFVFCTLLAGVLQGTDEPDMEPSAPECSHSWVGIGLYQAEGEPLSLQIKPLRALRSLQAWFLGKRFD